VASQGASAGSQTKPDSILAVWAFIRMTLSPAIGRQRPESLTALVVAFLAVFSLSSEVHAVRHLHAFQEDRILGREILPAAIGSQATRWLAATLLLVGLGSRAWCVGQGG